MKILSAKQIRLADAHTIAHEPISSIDLMERASTAFVDAYFKNHSPKEFIAVVCGTGNNGGDGLAISRLLIDKGFNISPFVIQFKEVESGDFLINLERLKLISSITIIDTQANIPSFEKYDTIIDAIFGSGLTRPVKGLYAGVIEQINRAMGNIVAVDIPSGLFMEKQDNSVDDPAIVKASSTISLQLPKLSFFMPENYKYVGQLSIVDIGLDNEFIEHQESNYSTLEKRTIRDLLPKRNKFAHKGTFGHGQLVGGSYGKMGAISLAAKAFLRTGAGLLSVTIPKTGVNIMQTLVPEAMISVQEGETEIEQITDVSKVSAIGIGPGLGKESCSVKALGDFLRNNSKSLVLDADALNIISENREMLSLLRENTVITPHIKEFDRLVGDSDNHWQRIERAREFSQEWQLIIVLKGANTAVIDPSGDVRFNTTGNPGMATAGSGDVLLGIITSLVTQGLSALHAAIAGVYIHGYAGDLAAKENSMTSLIASDIIRTLPNVFLNFER